MIREDDTVLEGKNCLRRLTEPMRLWVGGWEGGRFYMETLWFSQLERHMPCVGCGFVLQEAGQASVSTAMALFDFISLWISNICHGALSSSLEDISTY